MPLHRPSNTYWDGKRRVLFVVKEDFEPMATGKTEKKAASTSASPTVGRQELSRRIAQEVDISQKQAQTALEATLKAIREALQKGDEVRLVGFGSFKVRTSAARKGVNPRDQKPIHVPAKERVRFFPGKELADSVVKKK
ncbi:MAG TPA: HU family DNA-binding protein [Ktedonobacteraceae bacterium]|nr:HU family DNA-binding protein [Ktedonobacteraceae bacterium]